MNRKGIILAGGNGTRLAPITSVLSKQLIPVYDKPMIFYPLSTLMLAGIRDILIITTPRDLEAFKTLLGDGKKLGIKISYKVQPRPEGIAQSFILAEDFLEGSPAALILGDNIFYGNELVTLLKEANETFEKSTVFAYKVKDPERYGVITFNKEGLAQSIEEKPRFPKSNYVVTGVYFYDSKVVEYSKSLKPSKRGELEITDLNQIYLNKGQLNVKLMGRGLAWLDTGTFDSLNEASVFIKTLEQRQGMKVGSPEEVAWRQEWINDSDLKLLAKPLKKSGYGKYLIDIIKN